MIIYEDYNIPKKPLLKSDNSKNGLAFIRSEFEYSPRQRSTYKQTTKSGFSIVLKHWQLINFEQFWSDINFGADPFTASFFVHGNDNVNKTLRFTDSYTLKNLGNYFYEVSSEIEVISNGTPKSTTGALVPYETLYPSLTLYPSN